MYTESSQARVLLLEPNAPMRSAIQTVLAAEQYDVEVCDSLQQIVVREDGSPSTVALIAWQSMEGLLAEEHRPDLAALTRRVRLVVMVPRRWARLLEDTDLVTAVSGLVAKPFEVDELIGTLERALSTSVSLS